MLGQPISMLIPEVVGFRLVDRLPEGATATDLVLTITERLRKAGRRRQVRRVLRARAAVPHDCRSRDARQHVARVRRHDRDLPDRRDDARLPAPDRSRRGARTDGRSVREGAGAVPTRRTSPDPAYTSTLELDLSTVEPSLAGPKRPQDRVSLRQAKYKFQQALDAMLSEAKSRQGRAAEARRDQLAGVPSRRPWRSRTPSRTRPRGARSRIGRRRRDHELHQHLEPERDDWRRTAGAERREARIEGQAVGEDESCSGIARRHRVLQGRRAARIPRRARLQHRRLWLHDVHRQQRSLARTGVGDRQGSQPDRRLGTERQPQLRRPDPVAGARELPRVAAARRRLCARRPHADRHDDRTARGRQRRASRCI